MYRVEKVLNHNAVIAVNGDDLSEYLVLGKGIGFGKKVNERVELNGEETLYSLKDSTDRGNPQKLVKSISPICLEIADQVLNKAEEVFGKIDRKMLFPLADHIEFAVKRIQKNEQIVNPLTDDIRILFHAEYKCAECIEVILKEQLGIDIDEHEIGYIALHIHSALESENISQSLQMAQAVRTCVSMVEKEIGIDIDMFSLAYNRLMNHIRYIVLRAQTDEPVKVNINDYMKLEFPKSFEVAERVCNQLSQDLHFTLGEEEIGYLAMHVERVTASQ